jgi:DNA-binding NtrC family response regulator
MTLTGDKATAKYTVLIIDDEEVVRMLFQNLLEDAGYEPLLAEDGQQGSEMLREHHPAVALVDKNLPDISGLDLIATEKKRHPDTEFIMITGYASLDSAVKAMELGAFSYLTKPFDDMDVVLDRIRAAVEVNNLRVETTLLRDRLANLADPDSAPPATAAPATGASLRLLERVKSTAVFLESFLDKRNTPPSAATWARLVDMIEEECRLLKRAIQEEEK